MAALQKMRPAIEHHNEHNRHHPEHHNAGINDMNLIDLAEMLCDWKAATLRNPGGDIRKSLEISAKRFNIPGPIVKLLENTVQYLGW